MGKTYPNEIKRILFSPGGDVGREVRACALDIAAEAKRQALQTFGRHPMDAPRTLKLANSYQVKVIPGSNSFIVINPLKYAAAMEFGAKPHRIVARRTHTLRFRGRDGYWRRIKYVNHPGSVGRQTLMTATRIVMRRRYSVG